MNRFFAGLLVVLLSLSCDGRKAPSAPKPARQAPPVAELAAPFEKLDAGAKELRELWRIPGKLLGVTERHALVLDSRIVAVDLQTGAVSATAQTVAQDPVPSFDRHLPRLGESASDLREVDRLADAAVYVNADANVLAYLRGYGEVVTSLVGLDAGTFETRWVHPLAYRQPTQTCATPSGIFLLPPAPAPARFVSWKGEQKWQREVTRSNEKIEHFACRDDSVVLALRDAKRHRIAAFALASGDLIETREADADELAEAIAPEPTPMSAANEPRVLQNDDEVVSFGF